MESPKPIVVYLCTSASVLCGWAATANAQSTPCLVPLAVAFADYRVGDQITLRTDAPDPATPGWFGALDLDGNGADGYRDNLANCITISIKIGATVPQETGTMAGPTKQGMDTLFGRDPNAYWDTTHQCVVSSVNPSPRIVVIPLFDPAYLSTNHEIKVAGFQYFFVEAILGGKQIVGRATTANRTCTVTEPRETACNDGYDNDGDGAIDCGDDDCGCIP